MARNLSMRPRLDPEDRLNGRFYEPLVLLHVLDQHGGERISRCPSGEAAVPELTIRELRRTFLDQLAYVCDYIKGGSTVTAMALEEQPSSVIFWVACNTNFSTKTRRFLQTILEMLQKLTLYQDQYSRNSLEKNITDWCIGFNVHRIKSYQDFLVRNMRKCLRTLASLNEARNQTLVDWLRSFQAFKDDLPGLCHYAYQQRSSTCLKELNRHIGDETFELTNVESTKQTFLATRHYIGRLGSHLKAAKVLIMAGQRLPELFDNFTIRPQPSPKAASEPPPADGHTTLDGIVKRMLPQNSRDFPRYQEALAMMDTRFKIQEQLLDIYENQELKPIVHAELNLLEHLHKNRHGLRFVDNDRYIGCSKPACYCCYHYICLHPGGFVRPSSHGIRYLNWGAPDLDKTEAGQAHRLAIMNRLIAQIRIDVFVQINQRYSGPSPWHPDSTSGITTSINRGGLIENRNPGSDGGISHSRNREDLAEARDLDSVAGIASSRNREDLVEDRDLDSVAGIASSRNREDLVEDRDLDSIAGITDSMSRVDLSEEENSDSEGGASV